MKFTPLGNPLNSAQMHCKPLHLVKRQRSYEAVKHPYIYNWQLFDHSCLNILDSQFAEPTYMAVFWYNVQSCTCFH